MITFQVRIFLPNMNGNVLFMSQLLLKKMICGYIDPEFEYFKLLHDNISTAVVYEVYDSSCSEHNLKTEIIASI